MLGAVLLFLNIGSSEMILILFVALLLFGGEKLPGLARTLGKGIRDFKDASEGVKREINNQINNYDEKKPAVMAELPPATEQATTAEHVVEHPLIDTTPVAGTTPIGESYGINLDKASDHPADNHITENHIDATHVDTPAQPVKTTNE